MGAIATDVWEERWREGERGGGVAVAVGGGGDPAAAYQWVPFEFPGIIGGKKRGRGKMMRVSSDRC